MSNKVTEERTLAVRLAIEDIVKRHAQENGGEEPSTTQLGEWFGVTQQKMSDFKRNPTVGEKLADGVARHLKTTVDGLIRTYLRGEEGEVRAGDLPGWKEALKTARTKAGPLGEHWLWDEAEHVVLPRAPRIATAEFVHDIAYLLSKYGAGSGFMRKVK